jgi:hypothetical protein
MGTDWSKVIEVFGSGIIGVFLVMFLLQILTQLSTRIIDAVESRGRGTDAESGPPAVPTQD